METDELELDTLGDRKSALFVIISDTDDTFNFIVAMMYTAAGFPFMCAACLMKWQISVKFQSWKS